MITDPIARVLRTRICGQNQPSDAYFIEIRVSLTSKYGCRVLLATYTAIVLVSCIAILIKKSGHNDKLLSIEAMFGFCLLCKLSCSNDTVMWTY